MCKNLHIRAERLNQINCWDSLSNLGQEFPLPQLELCKLSINNHGATMDSSASARWRLASTATAQALQLHFMI